MKNNDILHHLTISLHKNKKKSDFFEFPIC